jgi:hypothetical protein
MEVKPNKTKRFVFIHEMMKHQMAVSSGAAGMSWSVLNIALQTDIQITTLKIIRKQMDKVFY